MRTRQAGLGFIFVTIVLDVLGAGMVIPVLPQLVASLVQGDVSSAAQYYGYFVALFSAMQFLFAPALGGLSDQYGRRPVLLLSLFSAAINYVLLAVAPNLTLLFVGRVLAGVSAANITAANAYIADISLPEQRARNFGLLGAAFGIGFIVGPLLGGVLGSFGERVPFWAASALTLVNALYGLFVLPESLPAESRRRFQWREANPLRSLRGLGRHAVVLNLVGTLVCTYLAQQALYTTWVLYTTYRFNWNSWEQGISLAFFGASTALVQAALLPVLLPRLGERRALVLGLVSSVVGYVLYGLATAGWMMYVIIAATGLSFVIQPAVQALITNAVPADEQGAIQGALTSLLSLTAIVGPIIATELFSYFTAPARAMPVPGAPFFLGAILMLAASLLAVRTFKRRHVPEAAQLS
ncbi:MAG TPA: TCR/Tet family MFS transporter [Roseiflexaceae bacterium]|nr:TCR/Tet family MFS transporter [Roseiflexaceae bacterium]